jgi:hypothetical protein
VTGLDVDVCGQALIVCILRPTLFVGKLQDKTPLSSEQRRLSIWKNSRFWRDVILIRYKLM